MTYRGSLADRTAMFNKKVAKHNETMQANPFSDEFKGSHKLSKDNAAYGK